MTSSVVGAGMIHGSRSAIASNGCSSRQFRRLIAMLCAVAFLIAGVVHVSHGAVAGTTAAYPAVIAVTDDGQDSTAKDRIVADACHCVAQAMLPAAAAMTDRDVIRVRPAWTGHSPQSRWPFAEPPPPRSLT